MAFTILQESTTAFSNKVNDNFYHIADGTFYPREGTSLTAVSLVTASAYNLGSSSYEWNNLFCNNLYYDSISADIFQKD